MIPADWLGVVFFLVLIAPGLLFDLLAGRRRASPTESVFREASRVVLASIAFSGFALLLMMLVRLAGPDWLPDPREALRGGATYIADNYHLVLTALALQLSVALGAAYGVHRILVRRQGGHIRPVSTWTRVLKQECPAGMWPYARVRLADGTVYHGAVGHFTADLSLEDREIVLVPPLFSKREDSQLSKVPDGYERVIIRAASIQTISVAYESTRPGRG